MKSVFNKIKKEEAKEIEFPVLAEAVIQGFVVLFFSECEGIVIKDSPHTSFGARSSLFVSVLDKSTWRILSPEESITLSND